MCGTKGILKELAMKIKVLIFITLSFFLVSCTKNDNVEAKPLYYKLEIELINGVGGKVDVYDIAKDIKIEKLDSIAEGTIVKLIPVAEQGYKFTGFWENDIYMQEENPSLIIERNRSLKAVFREEGSNPVEVFGDLKVEGSHIVDKNGIQVQLRGMSLFWSQWMEKYWNANVVNWLVLDWEVNIIRAAMGVDENGGYLFNATEKDKVETIVEAAIDNGIYVIIDWHSHHAEDYTQQAVEFFKEMAKKYGHHPNVIYEIYNEPLNVSWNNTIVSYAEKVIQAIRAEDEDNLIIVGTPNWAQDVDAVVNNTISDKNVAYGFHFYASEQDHHNRLFNKAKKAIDAGIPLFVTEWGVSEASGDGSFNKAWTQEWLEFMETHNLSWCNWSIADKDETASALLPGANSNGSWSKSELSASGIYIRDFLRANQGYSNPK